MTQDAQTENGTRPPPTPQPRAVICPYCGHVSGDTVRCARCAGRFDPLSRQATQNAMGPWSFIDPAVPTRAGCSYETLRSLVERGIVRSDSIVRGPSTRQFWMRATRVPGVAHLLGICHNCQEPARPDDYACASCGAVFEVDRDRQHLGVGPIRLIAGQVPEGQVVASMGSPAGGVAFESVPASDAPQPTGVPSGSPGASSAARDRLARHRAARKRRRAIVIGLTAAAVVAAGAAMFAIGVLAGSGDAPPGTESAAAP
ncbi:MAG: hypothetical protein RIB60_09060 [Phycisphaerales bacterium]